MRLKSIVLLGLGTLCGAVGFSLAQTPSSPAKKPATAAAAITPTTPAKTPPAPSVLESPPAGDICGTSSNAEERTRPSISETKTVYFVNLRDGDKVYSPFRIAFGLSGMGIAPAGVKIENTGHHHLLVDQKLTIEMLTATLPFTDNYRHFGKGQTEAIITLKPGKHTLRLLFADADHKPYYVYSREITVDVLPPKAG